MYDSNGNRVEKTGPNGTTVYVYDASGLLKSEYSTATNSSPCLTCYLSWDHLGSIRMVTDQNANVVARHDYLPFGEEIVGAAAGSAPFGNSDAVEQKFTSQIRDTETGNDFFKARYFAGPPGRFTSPDPVSGTVLHLINPRRWNMYSYALNNPLLYTDPDGRDAVVVDFGNKALGFGHLGIISVEANGSATFADFGPATSLVAVFPGNYGGPISLKTQISFDSDGLPTKASLAAVASELAADEKQPTNSITLDYFKTSPAETAALDAYIAAAKQAKRKGNTPWYIVGHYDCRDFCLNGLVAAGVLNQWNANSLGISTPNTIVNSLSPAASYYGNTNTRASVTSSITYGGTSSVGAWSPFDWLQILFGGFGSAGGESGGGGDLPRSITFDPPNQ